jgi:hypothetical protein
MEESIYPLKTRLPFFPFSFTLEKDNEDVIRESDDDVETTVSSTEVKQLSK